MLHSIIISLTAEADSPILGALGRPVQAWFLQQVARSSAALAQQLHDDKGTKPYTVSTLLDERGSPLQAGDWLKAGQRCGVRITTFGEDLSTLLQTHIVRYIPHRITLYKMDFRVEAIFEQPLQHAWAKTTSFAQIAQNAVSAKTVRMEFLSPTAFRSNGLDISLPMPGQVFRSLASRWNAFCPPPMQLHELWPDFAGACIFVNELSAVNTVHWMFAEGTRGAATGFTGTVGFHLPGTKQLPEQWQPYYEGAAAVMHSLAQFAFYAGVGHHTTLGMGQARPLPAKPK